VQNININIKDYKVLQGANRNKKKIETIKGKYCSFCGDTILSLINETINL